MVFACVCYSRFYLTPPPSLSPHCQIDHETTRLLKLLQPKCWRLRVRATCAESTRRWYRNRDVAFQLVDR